MPRMRLPIGALVTWSAFLVSLVVVGWSLPIDDFWLSVASGRAIANGADLAHALPFSWTTELPGALNPQWGAQLLLGWHGSIGVALVVNAVLLAVGLLATVARCAARASGAVVGASLLLTLAALAPHLLARAQSFSIALLPIGLLLLQRFGGRRWLPLAYGLLIVAWANLHGAFVVGQLVAGAWLVAALLERRHIGVAVLTAAGAAVAPLVNPVGAGLLGYAYGQPALDVVRSISVEWQPSWPWIAVATPFWVIVVAIVAGRVLRRSGASPFELLLLVLLGGLAISGIRHIPWFLLAAAPVLASDLQALVDRLPRLERALGAHGRPRRSGVRWAGLAVIGLAVVGFQLARPSLPSGVARLTADEPARQATILADSATPGDRVLNEQVWGGYLAYQVPTVLTAMDGRLEIRSRETWASYFALMQGRDDPAGELAERGVTWALVGVDRRELRRALESAGWTVTDEDDYAALLHDAEAGGHPRP